MTDRKKTAPLVTRVSLETADEFKRRAEDMGLSVNQLLKFLVLVGLGKNDDFENHVASVSPKTDEEEIEAIKSWLRGK